MGFYLEKVLPRIVDLAMGTELMAQERKKALQGVEGVVLEVGFGSGLNLPIYSDRVTKLYALDPALEGRKLARKRIEKVTFAVEYIGLRGEDIPLPDASVDFVVSTWTLCTIPDVKKALSEIRRVLKKPDGRFVFLEHGLSPDPGVRTWQRRLTPLQRKLVGGCHLDRPISELIAGSGFAVHDLERYYIEGPRVLTYLYRGAATPQSNESDKMKI